MMVTFTINYFTELREMCYCIHHNRFPFFISVIQINTPAIVYFHLTVDKIKSFIVTII